MKARYGLLEESFGHQISHSEFEKLMDLELLENFFFWCMLINSGVYVFTVVALFSVRGFVYRIHSKLFNMDREAVDKSTQKYLANYKLLITVFNFTPWIVILIIK